MGRKILMTGATGFVGSYVLEALVNGGNQVSILKRSTSNIWRIKHLLAQVKSYDIDKVPIATAFEEGKIETVIHLATHYLKSDDCQHLQLMVSTNIAFPLELIETAIKYGVPGFINTGSFFECDCTTLPVGEDAPASAFNFYAKTKLAFEALLPTYAGSISTMTLRLFSPYGGKDNLKLIPTIIQNALVSEPIQLSDGLQKLDFVYAEDVADAYLKACENLLAKNRQSHRVYNVASGSGISVREIISILEQHLGFTINKKWGERSLNDIPAVFADVTRAKDELGWTPRHSIHEGLQKTVNYYRTKVDNGNLTDFT